MSEGLRTTAHSAQRALEQVGAAVEAGRAPGIGQAPLGAVSHQIQQNGPRGYGRLFFNMRGMLGGGLAQVARQLETSPMVIRALEAEAVAQFPAWPEVQRVVRRYHDLTGMDLRPTLRVIEHDYALWQIQQHRGAAPVGQDQRGRVYAAPVPVPRGTEVGSARSLATWARSFAAKFAWLHRLDSRLLPAVLAVLFILAGLFTQASALQSSFATLEPRISHLMTGVGAAVSKTLQTEEPNLRWVVVEDPRARRTDRLVSNRPASR